MKSRPIILQAPGKGNRHGGGKLAERQLRYIEQKKAGRKRAA
jgi:hypothetical protein